MEEYHPAGLSGPETGYFQASDETFLSLVIKGVSDDALPNEESFFKTFDFLPFGAAISESICSDFFYANKALLNRLGVHLAEFQDQGVQLLNRGNGKSIKQMWSKLKSLVADHKKTSHDPFGCITRYKLHVAGINLNVMHNISEFIPASGQRLFIHIFLPDPELNFSENEIYIPCKGYRWKKSRDIVKRKSAQDLSQRELEIFDEMVHGKTSLQISEKLQLSVHTVKIHRKNILKKLKAKNTVEAIARMRQIEEELQKSILCK